MCNLQYLYSMSIKLELPSGKGIESPKFSNKWHFYVIYCGIGCFIGLSIFLMFNAVYTLIDSAGDTQKVIDDCKASVIKFVPLGAYPGGSQQVTAALGYCETLD
jgi:hypothetical protein